MATVAVLKAAAGRAVSVVRQGVFARSAHCSLPAVATKEWRRHWACTAASGQQAVRAAAKKSRPSLMRCWRWRPGLSRLTGGLSGVDKGRPADPGHLLHGIRDGACRGNTRDRRPRNLADHVHRLGVTSRKELFIGRVIIPTAPVPERPSIPCPVDTRHRSRRTRVRWPDPSVHPCPP
jgi:hypothetical protein